MFVHMATNTTKNHFSGLGYPRGTSKKTSISNCPWLQLDTDRFFMVQHVTCCSNRIPAAQSDAMPLQNHKLHSSRCAQPGLGGPQSTPSHRTIVSEEKDAINLLQKWRAPMFVRAVKFGISSVSLWNSQQYLQSLQNVALPKFVVSPIQAWMKLPNCYYGAPRLSKQQGERRGAQPGSVPEKLGCRWPSRER